MRHISRTSDRIDSIWSLSSPKCKSVRLVFLLKPDFHNRLHMNISVVFFIREIRLVINEFLLNGFIERIILTFTRARAPTAEFFETDDGHYAQPYSSK